MVSLSAKNLIIWSVIVVVIKNEEIVNLEERTNAVPNVPNLQESKTQELLKPEDTKQKEDINPDLFDNKTEPLNEDSPPEHKNVDPLHESQYMVKYLAMKGSGYRNVISDHRPKEQLNTEEEEEILRRKNENKSESEEVSKSGELSKPEQVIKPEEESKPEVVSKQEESKPAEVSQPISDPIPDPKTDEPSDIKEKELSVNLTENKTEILNETSLPLPEPQNVLPFNESLNVNKSEVSNQTLSQNVSQINSERVLNTEEDNSDHKSNEVSESEELEPEEQTNADPIESKTESIEILKQNEELKQEEEYKHENESKSEEETKVDSSENKSEIFDKTLIQNTESSDPKIDWRYTAPTPQHINPEPHINNDLPESVPSIQMFASDISDFNSNQMLNSKEKESSYNSYETYSSQESKPEEDELKPVVESKQDEEELKQEEEPKQMEEPKPEDLKQEEEPKQMGEPKQEEESKQMGETKQEEEPKLEMDTKSEEELEVDPLEYKTENLDQISNPNIGIIDPVIESQDMLRWLGVEGMDVTNVISDIIPDNIELILKQFQVSAQVVFVTFIVSVSWCLMKIILSIFISSKKETELRNICCKAERQVYYFEAEKQKLQSEIDRERDKARIAEERMQTAEHKVIPLEKEFNKLKNERDLLNQKVVNLESELESAAEAGLEANRLLNDFLTSQKENINLNSSVDALQQQITKQAEIVAKYESTAKQKEKENREIRDKFDKMSSELERMKNLLKETEHNLQIFQTNNEELKASKSELNSSLSQLEEEYSDLQKRSEEYFQTKEELTIAVEKLTEETNQLKEQTSLKDKEIESWKQMAKLSKFRKSDFNSDDEHNEDEEMDQMDSENCDQSLTELYDLVKMDIQLKNLTNDKNDLLSKLEEVNERCNQLTSKMQTLEVDNQNLKLEKESADRDKVKAENKLEVLTDHYRAKELEFGKEIGVQQVQRRIKEEDADSLANQLVDLKEENTSLRSQLVSMKKEIEDSERKYKSNINQLEKQVHENWILARNAERKLDEAKAEASVLRQTLTMSVKSPIDGFGGDASYMDDSASSISDTFGGALPPPPPPPMIPPPPFMNPMMPPMHMPFGEESDRTTLWNQTMNHSMNQMPMGAIPPFIPPMPNFNPIPSDGSMNTSVSFANSQPLSFVPQMQQMANQWDSTSNRDTFSPISHRSTNSPHSQYNTMYSQPNSHYSNPMVSMSSPMTNSSMSAQNNNNSFQNSMTSVTSPLVNSSPSTRPTVLSEPTPQHWTQPQRPNGNIPNFNSFSHNQYNESEGSSRPTSRNDRNDNSLHTSIV